MVQKEKTMFKKALICFIMLGLTVFAGCKNIKKENDQLTAIKERGRLIDEFKFNSSRDILWSLPLSETQLVPTLLPNNSGY